MSRTRPEWPAIESGTLFHTGATFFDYDRDGRLDLYVGGYVNLEPACAIATVRSAIPVVRPAYTTAARHALSQQWRWNIHQRDVAAGIFQPEGKNLAVGAADYDNDGWPDLFVANDGLNAYLYHNEHNGTFTEVGFPQRHGAHCAAATPWPPCASPWATTIMTAGSTSTSPISRNLPTTSGTTTGRAVSSKKSAIRPASPPHPRCAQLRRRLLRLRQ